MARTFDQEFEREVKRALRRVLTKDIMQAPLPIEAGGIFSVETMDAVNAQKGILEGLQYAIAKKSLFGKVKLTPDTITSEGYNKILQGYNTDVLDEMLKNEEIGENVFNTLNKAQYNLEKAQARDHNRKKWYISGKDLYKINGIPEDTEYYNLLNDQIVFLLPKGRKPLKRVYSLMQHDYKKDKYGDYVVEQVSVPSGSIFVCSKINIRLPYKAKKRKGFQYVDFYNDDNGGRVYIYAIPKAYLFKIEQLALVLTSRNRMNCYEMVTYRTWLNGKVSLGVIPYKPKEDYVLKNTKVLATAYGNSIEDIYRDNFSKKVSSILDLWVHINFMGNPKEFDIVDEYGDRRNLIVEPPTHILPMEDYKGLSKLTVAQEEQLEVTLNGTLEESIVSEQTIDEDFDEW